jgi:hypothetical protein
MNYVMKSEERMKTWVDEYNIINCQKLYPTKFRQLMVMGGVVDFRFCFVIVVCLLQIMSGGFILLQHCSAFSAWCIVFLSFIVGDAGDF